MDKAIQGEPKTRTLTEWASDFAHGSYDFTRTAFHSIGAEAGALESGLENMFPKAAHLLHDWVDGPSQPPKTLQIGSERENRLNLEMKTRPGESGAFWPDGPNADHLGMAPDFPLRGSLSKAEDIQLRRAIEELKRMSKTNN